uniref:Protein HGH1 homolog n=1 Tax=Alexandrium monilatum TaxID=311494 RepID=A0A7S4STL0_9DINO
MVDDGLQAQLALAVADGADSIVTALALSQRLGELRGGPEAVRLVVQGPPGGGGSTWGARLAAALEGRAGRGHSAALVAFERTGGYWCILEALSDARGLDPPTRRAFYAQFDDAALHAALLASLAARGGPADAVVRRCTRNLARSSELRGPLRPAVPALVEDLADGALAPEAAAALCNVACHSENKEQAVECGAVRNVVLQLGRPGQPAEASEDLVACLGVLTGGFEKGLAALFEVAVVEGRQKVFAPLFALLQAGGGSSATLQCMVLDVVGGLCAASPQFKAWAIQETPVVKTELPQMLRSDAAEVRAAALELAGMLVDADGFVEVFQRANGVSALQSVLEQDGPRGGGAGASGPLQFMAPAMPSGGMGGRRAPTQREMAQYLLSKILIL